ncbi:MAG: MFS transporter, partial [Deltaproteobacteria bacterium]|nr:MFS transporter [Deltaproteobacteria bacterium]
GHAGSDVETAYRSMAEIEAAEISDPLLTNARVLMDAGVLTGTEIHQMYQTEQQLIAHLSNQASATEQISSADEVMHALYVSTAAAETVVDAQKREEHFAHVLGFVPEKSPKKRHLAMLMNWALQDVMLQKSNTVLFGEDVARKGGVYHVTHGLQDTFGRSRVFNTLLDETTILGLAIGMAQVGFLPIPEIQYLAYYHNAQDQVRGEAASQSFFSNGQFINPMVIRIASYAYQRGFGGHFHNDNSLAALLDVPGLMILSPSRGDDAVYMFQHAIYCAQTQGRVVVFLEPIALYMQKDLYTPGDGKWLCQYPAVMEVAKEVRPKQYDPQNKDLLMISYANGVHMSLQASKKLFDEHGIQASVLDLRQLKPLPMHDVQKVVQSYTHVLLVDECRQWGGVCDRLLAQLVVQKEFAKKTFQTVQARDTYVPLGPAANLVLPQVADIVQQSVQMVNSN